MRIALDGLTPLVSLRGCDALVSPLTAILGSWRFRVVDTTDQAGTGPTVIAVERGTNGYKITSPWLDEPVVEQTEVGAVFSLAAEVACAFAEEKPDHLCFHCAAVETDGHLVLFPNGENAGKSTLATMLAARGLRLFADDVLPLSETCQEGIALGIAPRLRLPLPSSTGSLFHDFVAAHRGPRDNEFVYLTLPASYLAPHGNTAPLGATVFLDRQPSGAAKLTSMGRSHALRQMIVQNFAPGGGSALTLERLCNLIERTACFRLTYANLDEAAEMLCNQFSVARAPWREKPADSSHAGKVDEIAVELISNVARSREKYFTQSPGIALRAVDDDIFLVKPEEAGIFHLNAVAASLWRLLEQPTTLAAAIDAVRHVFPDANARRIKRDVRGVFATLQEEGLIRSHW